MRYTSRIGVYIQDTHKTGGEGPKIRVGRAFASQALRISSWYERCSSKEKASEVADGSSEVGTQKGYGD